MRCRSIGLICGVVLLAVLLGLPSAAGAAYHISNPCATNPCAAKAANPCAPKAANPCAAKPANPCNPCAGAAMAAGPKAKAVTMRAQVVRVEQGENRLTIQHEGQTVGLDVDRKTSFTRGTQKRSFGDLKPGDRVTVSFLDYGKQKKARYVYIAQAGAGMAANPCAANPCAAKPVNPCAPKAANPCAANPCAAKNPCAANPCAPKK